MLIGYTDVGSAHFGPMVYLGHPRAYDEYKSSIRISIPEGDYRLLIRGGNPKTMEGVTGIAIRKGSDKVPSRDLVPTLKKSDKLIIANTAVQEQIANSSYKDFLSKVVQEIHNPNYMPFNVYCQKFLNFDPPNLEKLKGLNENIAKKLIQAQEAYDMDRGRSHPILYQYVAYAGSDMIALALDAEYDFTAKLGMGDVGTYLCIEKI